MASFKGIKNAHEENKMLKLLGTLYWETEVFFDPQRNEITAENKPIGKKSRIRPPLVILGTLNRVVTMTELRQWVEEKLETLQNVTDDELDT